MTTSSSIMIREYREADQAAVIELVRDVQAHESAIFDLMKPPEAMDAWYLEHLKDEVTKYKGCFLVAEAADHPVGYATLLVEVPSNEPEEIDYTYSRIADLSVANAYRGKGIGTALLRECEARARSRGQAILSIGVLAGNHGARKLYGAFGFRDLGIFMTKSLK